MVCPRLAPFKVPTIVEFRPELPRTAVGKTRKSLLRHPGVRAGEEA